MAVTISTGIMGDVLGDGATAADYERYADLVAQAIMAAYPDASVNVHLDMTLIGSTPLNMETQCYRDDLDGPDEEMAEEVDAICEHVFTSGEWAA